MREGEGMLAGAGCTGGGADCAGAGAAVRRSGRPGGTLMCGVTAAACAACMREAARTGRASLLAVVGEAGPKSRSGGRLPLRKGSGSGHAAHALGYGHEP